VSTILAVVACGVGAIALLLLVPVGVLTVQVLAACSGRGRDSEPEAVDSASSRDGTGPRPSVAVVLPAHDEAAGLAPVVAAVRAGLRAGDRVLVVADNCSDRTAAIALAAGAEVVERHDPVRRGKGYALDCGIRHLSRLPPDVVVFVDADCLVAPDAIDRLVRRCSESGRPVQALYLMQAPATAGSRQRIAALAWIVKNQARALGSHRLRLPCQLTGTGMAFPWSVIESAPLASGHIVEDLQLGLDLAVKGSPPLFCPEALVTSMFPIREEGVETQRTRWEHGHLGVIATVGLPLLRRAIGRRQWHLAAMALDVCVPPLALLGMALVVVLMAAGLLATASWLFPLFVAATAMALFLGSVGLAWNGWGRQAVALGDLLAAPIYMLRKLPMYVRVLGRRETRWVRTKRDDRSG
jgi:cellulose synthase/poly-beta-1,6-N-acetylglucosamine synthase-like glycosyltransferase